MMNDRKATRKLRSVIHPSSLSFSIHNFLLAAWFLCLTNLGCRPALEVSDQAKPTRLLERDSAEDGVDVGRWAQWRGRNGSGIAPAGSPPFHFSDSEGYRWKTPLPGSGNSSPVVWDDAVVLTAEFAETDLPKLAVLCLDRRDGRLLWQTDAGTARGRTHVKNGYASASVTTDGQHIFASFGGLGLFCYDFAGKQQWHVDFEQVDHVWGLASSPVLFGETVIQLCDFEGESFIAAYNKETGRQVWKMPRSSTGSWSTPVFVEATVDGRRRTEMIVQGGSGLRQVIAYDPTHGEELWRMGETTDLVTPLPVLCNGLVYCASGRNGPILAIRPGGNGDVLATHVVWKTSRGGPYIPSGLCYRNRLYLIGDGGPLCCYDPGDGRLVWQTRLTGPFTSSLIAADGRIYAVNERGTVTVFAAGDTYERLATNEMHSPCLATPAVANGELFLRTKTDLYCFADGDGKAEVASNASTDRGQGTSVHSAAPSKPQSPNNEKNSWPLFRDDPQATGVAPGELPEKLEPLWTFSTEKGGFESTAAIVDGTVYIGSTDGKLYALDFESGKKRWEFATPLGFSASAAVRGERVYIGDADGMFYCLDAASGKRLWEFQTDAEINSSANFHNDNVLFGSQDSYLYCLNADSGKLVWKFQSQDQIRCFPTVVENLGFVAGCDGHLHVIDLAQGIELGAVKIDSPTGSSPAVMDGIVFVGTEGHNFFAIDPRQNKIVWRYESPDRGAAFRSSAAVTPDAVLVGSRDKQLHALDPKTGRSLWSFPTKGRVDSSPVVVGGRVFVGSADGRLYGLSVKTGEMLWQFELGGAVIASPAVANGRLVIGNDSGELYCFGEK
jgi:outer membrane protein assembly factor BamB